MKAHLPIFGFILFILFANSSAMILRHTAQIRKAIPHTNHRRIPAISHKIRLFPRSLKDVDMMTDEQFDEEKGKFLEFLNEESITIDKNPSKKKIMKIAKKYLKKVHHMKNKEIKELQPVIFKMLKLKGLFGGD